jgi:hypothetical protein
MRVGLAIVILALAGAFSTVGTPHVLNDERCASYDKGRHCAYVISCTYVGVQGYQKIFPDWTPDVRICPGVRWFPLASPVFQWREAPKLLRGEVL